jgi:hypothetical protein
LLVGRRLVTTFPVRKGRVIVGEVRGWMVVLGIFLGVGLGAWRLKEVVFESAGWRIAL